MRFVEAKRDGVKYSPDQPRVPAGNPDGGQWTAEGGTSAGSDQFYDGGDGSDPSADHSGQSLPIEQVQFSKEEREMTAEEFISANCKASILREFPSEYLPLPIGEIESLSGAKRNRCVKLLREDRFRKGGGK